MNRQGNILLYPFSLIYGAVTGFRNFLYDSGVLSVHRFNIPIICVGNITVGGTGKTPHCEYIIDLLKDKFSVALLSRGYKRKTKGFLLAVPGMGPSDTGDEPLQICRKFPGITVAVDRNRVKGVESLLKIHPETDVIILDDAFQHRRIKPGYSVLLTDFSGLMTDDHMLPYGELRESVKNMLRADIILITKTPPDLSPVRRESIAKEIRKASWQTLFFTSLTYKDPVPVFPSINAECDLFKNGKKENRGIVLVTGIARAELLKEYLGNYASEMIHFPFPDHHDFSLKDITRITEAFESLVQVNKYIITTEKDAVRLREFNNIAEPVRSSLFCIPVGITFLNDEGNEFDNLIIEYVRTNK
ncbi:MAG: tetraacyldisaccharide 4'-kinase [Bacteroidales bacterium]